MHTDTAMTTTETTPAIETVDEAHVWLRKRESLEEKKVVGLVLGVRKRRKNPLGFM
jgi:hypothetical protein